MSNPSQRKNLRVVFSQRVPQFKDKKNFSSKEICHFFVILTYFTYRIPWINDCKFTAFCSHRFIYFCLFNILTARGTSTKCEVSPLIMEKSYIIYMDTVTRSDCQKAATYVSHRRKSCTPRRKVQWGDLCSHWKSAP